MFTAVSDARPHGSTSVYVLALNSIVLICCILHSNHNTLDMLMYCIVVMCYRAHVLYSTHVCQLQVENIIVFTIGLI